MSRLARLKSLPTPWEKLMQRTMLSRWPRLQKRFSWNSLIVATAILLIDALMPASGAITMLYVLPATIALSSRRQGSLIQTGLICSLFIIAGFFLGPSLITSQDELIQRGCALVALGLISWVGWQLAESVEAAQQLRVDSCLRQVAEEAATFFRSMVDHVPIGVSRTDLSGRFVFVNEAFCRMFDASVDDLLGKTTEEIVPKPLAEETADEERRVAESDEISERIERVAEGDREQFVKVIRTPVKDGLGQIIGVQSIWLDVTELKHSQHVLERHAQNLERSNVNLQQFAYVASHDLQEPLRAISNYCQLFEKHYSHQLDERGLRWLEFAVNGSKRMQTLVRDLLAYARIDNKSRTWITVDSRVPCLLALENLSKIIEETHAKVTVGKLPVVWADAVQLEALFQNLINNAVKFRGDRTPEISITAEKLEDSWQFAVRDNGIGIKPEFHDRVFEIFKRLQTSEKYDGTGIGLAICKRIVERFGGRIWVESQFGSGCTFYFTLPRPPDPSESEHGTT